MDIRFFTWNVKNNSNASFYTNLNNQLVTDEIDILVLQECFQNIKSEFTAYNEIDYHEDDKGKRWVRIFIKNKTLLNYYGSTSYESNKLRCITIETPQRFKFNVAGIHLYSLPDKSLSEKFSRNSKFVQYIEEFESKQGIEDTVILGDLNYRPFDLHLIHPHLFNTTNDKNILRLFKKRKWQINEHRYFYNPMWNLLGDYDYISKTAKVTGTYYWYADDVEKYNWNLIDGVLLTAELMNKIDIESLQIVTFINGKSLIKKSLDQTELESSLLMEGFSDHLPVKFKIKAS